MILVKQLFDSFELFYIYILIYLGKVVILNKRDNEGEHARPTY